MTLIDDAYTYDEIFEAAAAEVFDRLVEADLLDRSPQIEALEDAQAQWLLARIRARGNGRDI